MGFESRSGGSAIKTGWIVEIPGDLRRIGTAIAAADGGVVIEYFRSLAVQETATVPLEAVRRAYLSPQTRVYFRLGGDDRWRIGRVRNYNRESDTSMTYQVRSPNKADFDVHESDLRVRCFGPGSNPADVLTLGGAESQMWHDARWGAREVLTRLRSAANGMSGLASASIELVPHQAEAVKRVLLDPLQRYLLADEVGMGKTIEAGAIIRQTMTDHSSQDVLVVAPAALVGQWRSELRDRFGLSTDGGRLRLAAFDSLEGIPSAHLVVVDEAHRCGPGTPWSGHVERLVRSATKLLLLSATPVVGAEEAFLAMLRWLDEDRWARETPESFRDIVRKSQDHGRLLLGFRADASAFLLKQRVASAASAFPGDPRVQELAQGFAEAPAELKAGVSASLRDHIADAYRIHHRLVRARRSDLEGWEFKPRGPSGVREEANDGADEAISTAIEDWRSAAVLAAEGGSPESVLATRYAHLLELAGIGVDPLAGIDLGEESFAGEGALVEAVRQAARSADPEAGPVFLARIVERQIGFLRKSTREPKVVVFTSGPTGPIVERLGRGLGDGVVDPSPDLRAAVTRFERASEAVVLVLGRDGEEGLNLHFADAIVHADLPMSVVRIEQRIGRLDRFGRTKGPVRHVVAIPSCEDDNPWSAWLETLRTGFGIFDRSVSDIQFAIEDIEADLRRALLLGNGPSLMEGQERLRSMIGAERQKLDEQYALDRLAFTQESGKALVESMEEAEADEGAMARHVERLLFKLLGFERKPAGSDAFEVDWVRDTQLPAWPWRPIFEAALGRPATWRRGTAERSPGLSLLRPGDPLIDALERLLDWDDRGSAFATWRFRPSWGPPGEERLVLRLCWYVAPGRIGGGGLAESEDIRGLERRAASFLRPMTFVQNLWADGRDVDDPALNAILDEPYRTEAKDGAGRDFNLGSRPSWLGRVIDQDALRRLCAEAERTGLSRILADASVLEKTLVAARDASRDAERRSRRPDRRAAWEARSDAVVMEAVSRPQYRLDSFGIMVVAGYAPQERRA